MTFYPEADPVASATAPPYGSSPAPPPPPVPATYATPTPQWTPQAAPAPAPWTSPYAAPTASAPPLPLPPQRTSLRRRLGWALPIGVAAGIVYMVTGGWDLTASRVDFTVDEGAKAAPIPADTPYGTYGSSEMVRSLEQLLVEQSRSIDVTRWASEHGADAIMAAVQEAATQNPYIYVDSWKLQELGGTLTLDPGYSYEDQEAERRRSQTRQAAADALIASGAHGAASDAEKATLIHHFIVSQASYDFEASDAIETGQSLPIVQRSQEAYGILVEGTAVCAGYSMAFTAMAELAGLDAVTVTGTDSTSELTASHAWNKVLIDGQWLLVDTTWDDPDRGPDRIDTDYLLVADGDPLLSTRVADDSWVMPESRALFSG